MIKQKTILAISVCVTGILVSMIFVNAVYLQTLSQEENGLCSEVTKGLKFCSSLKKISVNLGSEIVLNLSLINKSDKKIAVKSNRDLTKYGLKITDEKGNVLESKIEKKLKDNSMSYDDQKNFIHSVTTNNHSDILEPGQTLEEKIILTDIYDFDKAGIYFAYVTRKTMDPTGNGFIEIPLEKINLEVK